MGKCSRLHSPSRARALDQGLLRGNVNAQHQRDPQHAFIAYEADFETGMTVDRRDQGDEAVRGEEGVPDAIAGPVKHLGKREINLLAACKQALTILAGQSGEQKVFSGAPRRW
jgi:hypothetical protein